MCKKSIKKRHALELMNNLEGTLISKTNLKMGQGVSRTRVDMQMSTKE